MTEENKTSISQAETVEEIGEFWDTPSFVDYLDETQKAAIEVRAIPKRRVTLDPDVCLYTY